MSLDSIFKKSIDALQRVIRERRDDIDRYKRVLASPVGTLFVEPHGSFVVTEENHRLLPERIEREQESLEERCKALERVGEQGFRQEIKHTLDGVFERSHGGFWVDIRECLPFEIVQYVEPGVITLEERVLMFEIVRDFLNDNYGDRIRFSELVSPERCQQCEECDTYPEYNSDHHWDCDIRFGMFSCNFKKT